jgi:hypothetical protein
MSDDFLRLLRSRPFLAGSTLWVLAGLAAVNVQVAVWRTTWAEERRRNMLVSNLLHAAGETPRYDWSVGENLGKYWPCLQEAASNHVIIVTGMSQMYAINDRQPGDTTVSECLDDALAGQGVRVFGLAAPNLCNEEATLLLLATLSDPRTHPRAFVFGACFDKFRNIDLRKGYQAFLRQRPPLRQAWVATIAKYRSTHPLATAKMAATLAQMQKEDTGSEAGLEEGLQDTLGRCLPLMGARKELAGHILTELYFARNRVLGIRASSKRPILQERYDMNRDFLLLLQDIARTSGVRFLCLVNPLNPQTDTPYVAAEYRKFKDWLRQECAQNDVRLADLERVVPAEAWGCGPDGQPDFKHFTGAGHRYTARAILSSFEDVLVPGPAATRAEP